MYQLCFDFEVEKKHLRPKLMTLTLAVLVAFRSDCVAELLLSPQSFRLLRIQSCGNIALEETDAPGESLMRSA